MLIKTVSQGGCDRYLIFKNPLAFTLANCELKLFRGKFCIKSKYVQMIFPLLLFPKQYSVGISDTGVH